MLRILALFVFFISSAPPLVSLGETLDQIGDKEMPDGTEPLTIGTLKDIALSQEQGRLTVTMKTDRSQSPTVFQLDHPPRLVLDFQNTVNKVPFRKLPLHTASAKRLRVGQFQSESPMIARVVFDLENEFVNYKITSDNTSVQVVFFPGKPDAGKTTSGTPEKPVSTAVKPVNPSKRTIMEERIDNPAGMLALEVIPESAADSGAESSQVIDFEEQNDNPAGMAALVVLPEPKADSGAESSQVVDFEEQTDKPAGMVASEVEETRNGPALIRDLRYWTTRDSTHIEIEMDGEAEYEGERIANPDRIFFDISAAKLSTGFGNRTVVVENELLKRIRVAQNRPEVVRVVFDISAVGDYSVRKLQDPDRMVVDLYGLSGRGPDPALEAAESGLQETVGEADAETALNTGEAAGVASEVLPEHEADSGAESSQVVDFEEQINNPAGMVASEVLPEHEADSGAESSQAVDSTRTALSSQKQDTGKTDSGTPEKSVSTAVNSAVANKIFVTAKSDIPPRSKSDQRLKPGNVTAPLKKSQAVPEVIAPPSLFLGETLDLIGKSVENFRKQFESVACTELVTQTKLKKKNSVIYKKNHEYDYMIFMNIRGNELRVEESRQMKKTKGKSKDMPLLVTEGFPTLLFIFHPYYQGSFEYRYSGEEIVEGRNLIKIEFRHIHGERSTSVLNLEGENYPLELTGTAWIDPESHNIRRIKSELIEPMEALGLQSFNSDVQYQSMQLTSMQPAYWLPETATVEVMTKQQHWINTHRFKDYKLFSVSTESNITIP
jgi:hypothetical protein